MIRQWSTRVYREGDEEKIYELWQVIHPSTQRDFNDWIKWWHWMYQENPAGEGLIRLAEDSGKIIAQHMMTPLRLYINGEIVNACMGMEAMTHPDYRRQGLFSHLTKEVFNDAANRNIVLQTGMPNELSGAAYGKIEGWVKVATAKVMIKPLKWKNVIRLKLNNGFLSGLLAAGCILVFDKIFFRTHQPPKKTGLTITEVTSFDERFDRLWNRMAGKYPIMTVRNSEYLNWRYNIPGIQYSAYAAEESGEVCGYITLSERSLRNIRVCYIADMIAESEDTMHYLVAKGVEACRLAGVDLLSYSLLAGEEYHRVLRDNGFIFYPLIRNSYLGVYSMSEQFSNVFLQNPKNWFFQHGDTDTI